jgi:non-ribosomal peptide synthetase component F
VSGCLFDGWKHGGACIGTFFIRSALEEDIDVRRTIKMQAINSIYEVNTPEIQPSLFHGPADPPLVTVTLGEFLDIQCERYGEREALVFPWTGTRWTYNDLKEESSKLARYLYSRGIRPGDRIAVLAGNRVEYASVFFACMRIGAVLVILNNTYTIPEAEYALKYTGK